VEVVEYLWNNASEGQLLNLEGWNQVVAHYFTKVSDIPGDSSFSVVSNRYWILDVSKEGSKIQVSVETVELGRIDSRLRFVAAPKSHSYPQFYLYYLVFGPTPMRTYGPDGKTLIEEKMTGPNRWKIEGSLGYRWTTVNTALRYVTEARDTSRDPAIKKNADQTLAVLRRHH
jgi:hypothetical protein